MSDDNDVLDLVRKGLRSNEETMRSLAEVGGELGDDSASVFLALLSLGTAANSATLAACATEIKGLRKRVKELEGELEFRRGLDEFGKEGE